MTSGTINRYADNEWNDILKEMVTFASFFMVLRFPLSENPFSYIHKNINEYMQICNAFPRSGFNQKKTSGSYTPTPL